MLTAAQLDAIKDLIQIFESLEVLIEEVSGENYVTRHYVARLYQWYIALKNP